VASVIHILVIPSHTFIMTPCIKENTFITSFHYREELHYWLAVQSTPQPVKPPTAPSLNGLLINLRFIHPEERNCMVCQNIKKLSLLYVA